MTYNPLYRTFTKPLQTEKWPTSSPAPAPAQPPHHTPHKTPGKYLPVDSMMMKRAGFIIPGSIVGARGPPGLGGRGLRAQTMGVVTRHGGRGGAARPPAMRISRGLGAPAHVDTGPARPVPASAAPAGGLCDGTLPGVRCVWLVVVCCPVWCVLGVWEWAGYGLIGELLFIVRRY